MSDRGLPRILVVLLVAAALTITLAGVRSAGSIIGPVVLALVLTITLHPLRATLQRRGLPGWAASTVMLLAAYLLLLALTAALVVSVGRLAVLVPSYADDIDALVRDVGARLADVGVGPEQVDAVQSAFDLGSLVGVATSLLSSLLGVLSDLFFLATVLLFMAFDTASTTDVLERARRQRPMIVDALRNFALGTRSYMAVSAGFGFVVAVIDWVALELMGIPGAFVWGVLAFVTNFIPNIGFVIGVIPPAVIALLEGGPDLMLAVLIVYSVINVVIQTVIQPRVVGDRVGLSGTVTFLSLVFWAWAIGPLGALLAIPLSLLLRAVLVEADPDARWVLPLISGKPDPDPTDPDPTEPDAADPGPDPDVSEAPAEPAG